MTRHRRATIGALAACGLAFAAAPPMHGNEAERRSIGAAAALPDPAHDPASASLIVPDRVADLVIECRLALRRASALAGADDPAAASREISRAYSLLGSLESELGIDRTHEGRP